MRLLNITTTPLLFEFSNQKAQLIHNVDKGNYSLQKSGGYFDRTMKNTEVRIDTTQRRNSMGLRTVQDMAEHYAQKGKADAQQAIARYVELGNQMLMAHKGSNISGVFRQRMMQDAQTELALVPLGSINFDWNPATMQQQYTPVSLDFDWRAARTELEYVPPQLRIDIKQHPSIAFEYLGRPIYAPPSADPEYSLRVMA